MKTMSKTLTIVATAHYESIHDRIFVDSMLNQSNQNFKAIIIHNGPNDEMRQYVTGKASNIIYHESKTDTGMYGCKNRQWTIDHCDTEYIIQTSISDYYLPQAVEFIQKMLEQSPDCALFNAINHIVSPCQMLDCQLAWSKIDWGMAAVKTWIAKEVGINHPEAYTADFLFFKDCIDKGYFKKVLKSSGILTIHN